MAVANHETQFDVGVDAAFSETSLHKVPNEARSESFCVQYFLLENKGQYFHTWSVHLFLMTDGALGWNLIRMQYFETWQCSVCSGPLTTNHRGAWTCFTSDSLVEASGFAILWVSAWTHPCPRV